MIVSGKTDEEHLENLESVLKRLQDAGLKANKEKCEFDRDRVQFCGHEIDREGLHKTQEKIEAVVSAPRPENVSQPRSFLGLVNYYNRFLPNASTVLHPLPQLLEQNSEWQWTEQCERAFTEAKRMITSEQVLTDYDPALPVRLACDASPIGIAAVLSHVMPDGIVDQDRTQVRPDRQGGIVHRMGAETVPCVPLWEAVHVHYRSQAPHCHFPPREGSSFHDRCETPALCYVPGWFRLQDRV